MPYVANRGAVATTTLASAVTDTSTFNVNYPSGWTQEDFINGLLKVNASYGVVNHNDKFNAYGGSGARFTLSFASASYVTVTNNTGTTLAAGSLVEFFFDAQDDTGVVVLGFPVDLADVTAADVVTSFKPGVAGTLEDVQWVQRTAVTTGSKAATITPYIDGVAVTGGVLSLTSAACTPLGKVVAASQVTAGNTLNMNSKLTFTASAVTAFVEGKGNIYVRIRRSGQQA